MTQERPLWLIGSASEPTQDRPVEREEDDQLDRGEFVDRLARALVRDERTESGELKARRSTGYVVGLTGSWGAGKSSVLNLLALHLSTLEQTIVVKFNPWLFRGRDELLAGFFNEMREGVGRSKVERANELIEALDEYRGAIEFTSRAVATGIDLAGGSGIATAVQTGFGLWKKREAKGAQAPSLMKERTDLEKKLKSLDAAVVVLIDELDRVEDEDVRSVAQLVKAVGDIKGISYLVAYDPARVADALGRGKGLDRLSSGYSYLEKIIQHPIPLRPMFAEDVDRVLLSSISNHKIDLPSELSDQDRKIFDKIKRKITTPRDIKRLIGSYSVIEEAVRGEVNPVHILAYCWILTKAPILRDRIAEDLDRYVDDPSEEEMIRRAFRDGVDEKESLLSDEYLGVTAKDSEDLFKVLFPRFGEQPDERDGTRLSRRRNLVKVLYLGNPPGHVTRRTIEDIWATQGKVEVETELRKQLAEGLLPSFLDRLDDLLSKLPASGDDAFWAGLSAALTRQENWLKGPEVERNLTDDAAQSLYQLGLRNKTSARRVRKVIDSLIHEGDLLFVPWILRKHMWQHGLVPNESARGGRVFLDKEETEQLLRSEVPRYRKALLDGTLLTRIPDIEAMWVLVNGGFWDESLSHYITEQLHNPQAVVTLAGLLTPPGYVMSQEALGGIVDLEVLKQQIENLAKPEDPWVAQSVRRLDFTAKGKDTMFMRDEPELED